MKEFSPTGKLVCESEGPLDAELVLVGESPAGEEMANRPLPRPFVGKAGKLLNAALTQAGIDRTKCRVMNCIPVRAPGDKFAMHDPADVAWAKQRFAKELGQLTKAKVFVALGANPTEWLLGGKPPVASYDQDKDKKETGGFITQWQGSIIPVRDLRIAENPKEASQFPYERYLVRLNGLIPPKEISDLAVIIPSYHPAAILRQYTWHPWLVQALKTANKALTQRLDQPKLREWYVNRPQELGRLCNPTTGEIYVDLISVDTEMSPQIIGICTAEEVHVFEWTEYARPYLTLLLTSEKVVKVAQNWSHDFAWLVKNLGITVTKPIFDTQGGAHVLNTALGKSLSDVAKRFTYWPQHKWVVNHNALVYCGLDTIVTYDAYWPMMEELAQRRLMRVAEFDHRILMPLMLMGKKGFRINEEARQTVENELWQELEYERGKLEALVRPIVTKRIGKFLKPHLFRQERSCECCGGGKLARTHCWKCGGLPVKPTKKADYISLGSGKVADLRNRLPECRSCSGSGKVTIELEFNSDSSDQLADVIYRGLGIRPRKFKGVETVKAAQLDPIKDQHPVIEKIVQVSKLGADYGTVNRLTAGNDGRLHCVLDPFGTGSGRVAGKEGLVYKGTNPMNLPKAARRFVVPDEGYILLYPDMSQIEMRAVALLSKDPRMMKAFLEPVNWPGHPKHGKIDSHTQVVKAVTDLGLELTRDGAKRLVYAWAYGGQPAQVSQEINAEAFRKGEIYRTTPEGVGKMFDILNYKLFPAVHQWQLSILEEVQKTRKLRCPLTGREFTWLGYIIETNKKSPNFGGLKNEIRKQVWSRLPQNMGAWILGLGLYDIYQSDDWFTLLTPLIHVHDALLIQTPVERQEEGIVKSVNYLSRDFHGMNFPAEMKVGKNWYECS